MKIDDAQKKMKIETEKKLHAASNHTKGKVNETEIQDQKQEWNILYYAVRPARRKNERRSGPAQSSLR